MIVKMKKAKIVILKDDYDKVIKSLQKYGVIMIINQEDGDSTLSEDLNSALHERVEETIKFAGKYQKKKGLFGDYQVVDYNDFVNVSQNTINEVSEIESLNAQLAETKLKIKELNDEIESLMIWNELDMIPNQIRSTKNVKVHVGILPTRQTEKFMQEIELNNFDCTILPSYKTNCGLITACFIEDEATLKDIFGHYEYSDYKLPNLDVLVKPHIESLKDIITKKEEECDEINAKLKSLSNGIENFKILSDQILTQDAINNVKYKATVETIVIEGWVRVDTLSEVEKAVSEQTEYYDIEFTDPTDDDVVPTYTKNKKFVSQFETITDMFSKPNSKEVDPNPVMSVWYWFLFGMMMGDAGYGIMMIVFCLILKKLMRPKGNTLKLINVIMYSGVPTIFWGIMFGSYFGFNPQTDFGLNIWYWFNPMEDPIKMLLVSVAVGALHLITGLVVKMVENIRDGNIIDMLAKNVSWILILLGIGAYFLNSMVGLIMVGVGVALIILFAGHAKKSILGKTLGGILGLYDVTSYMGDLLSYSRIMALAMSSAAVAVVMNTLAQMVGGSVVGMIAAALIFIVGHVFNLVLGLLSAYVHDSRLQYIEFYGKFYEGGGVDFKPLSIQTKYVKEIKE